MQPQIPNIPPRFLRTKEAAEFLRTMISYQHPDHDTDQWPVASDGAKGGRTGEESQ